MSDFQRRMSALHERMAVQGIGAALLTAPAAVYYFTGLWTDPMERFLGLWLAEGEEAVLFVPKLDAGKAESAASAGVRIWTVDDATPPQEAMRQACRFPSSGRIGVDKLALNWHLAERIQEICPETAFADIRPTTHMMMASKSREEADLVRRAAQIADRALEAALGAFRVGMRERELAEEIARQIRAAGGEGLAFGPTVVSGVRTALPHADTTEEPIREGGLLIVDMGVVCRHYLSDMTRTFLVGDGNGNGERVRLYETVRVANERAVAAVRLGAPLSDIDDAARQYIDAQGYGEHFIHRVGHGLGLTIHEEPSIHHRNRDPVLAGMIFTVEPGIYVPGVGGVRIEDDVYVDENGTVDVLTAFSRELRRL